jgi:HNH endonuclease
MLRELQTSVRSPADEERADIAPQCIQEAALLLADVPRNRSAGSEENGARMSPPVGYRGTIAERFDRFTIPEPNSGCLLWLGAVDQHGYGQLRIDGRARPATHIALELAGRPVPAGLRACHHCDNPLCANAQHLFVGSQRDNVADMVSKARADFSGLQLGWGHQKSRPHCYRGHPWTPETTAIRTNKDGSTYRDCRICRRVHRRNTKQRRKARGL